MKIEMEIEFDREEIDRLLVKRAQELYPAPNGYHYWVRNVYMNSATVELAQDTVPVPELYDGPAIGPAVPEVQ